MIEMDSRSGEIPAEIMGVSAPVGLVVVGVEEDRRKPERKEMSAIG